jgi:2-polyprenyl-6-methoxyphenol hydroxylase-like FAD-dependent oxidoreductase
LRRCAFPCSPVNFWRGTRTVHGSERLARPGTHGQAQAPTPQAACVYLDRANSACDNVSGSAQWRGVRELFGPSGQRELADALKDFEGWHQDILDLFINSENLFRWGLFVRDPLDRWSKGRVTLVGDACHSMTPYLGMGVNVTMEDAYVLARCLEQSPDNVVDALRRYETARIERANRTKASSMGMLSIFHNPALAQSETAWPYIEKQWSSQAVRERYDWLLAYDATSVEI